MKNEILSKAKAGLILDQPFFASILLSLPMIEVKDPEVCPTLATDGDAIYVNPDYLATKTLPEVTFLLAHETLHCVFQHMFRREERDASNWNIAADYVINDVLVKERIGTMPKGGLLDPGIVAKGNGTTEGVYNLLPPPKPNQKPGSGKDGTGGSIDEVRDAGKDEAERSQKEAEMKVKLVQAKNAAKMAGKLSAGIDRLVQELTKPQIDWRSVLRRFLSERAKIDLSYAKPKRRFLADDLYLPSLVGERLGVVAVGVDCSGSISDQVLQAFTRELKGIFEDTKPVEVRVVYFDSEVLKRDSFTQDDTVEIKPVGGGGTAFSPVFEALNQDEIQPVACVMLTDLCCNDFGDAPAYPVLWASTEDGEAPFGDVMRIQGE